MTKKLDCFIPGEVLTLAQLRALPDKAVVYMRYEDEDGHVRMDDFGLLNKDESEWWDVDDYPFPICGLSEDSALENIENSGWLYTIKSAVPSKKGTYRKRKKTAKKAKDIMAELIEIHNEYISCADKSIKKELKNRSKILERELKKMKIF